MELDPIVRDLGTSALALRPQESCSCKPLKTLNCKTMGLFVILILFLILSISGNLLWSMIPFQILTITVRPPKTIVKEKEKR